MSDTSNLISEKKALQLVGKDAAWTFKELYKTSDWYNLRNGILLIVPILLTLYALVFANLSQFWEKTFELFGLAAVFIALITQGTHAKAALYQKHANEFKDVFDEAAAAYLQGFAKAGELNKKISKLRQKTIETPISIVGRWWAKWRIESEMDLSWVKENPVP